MAGRIEPSTIRMAAPVGVEAHQDFTIETGGRSATLVATLEGTPAIALREIVVQSQEAGPDPDLEPDPGTGGWPDPDGPPFGVGGAAGEGEEAAEVHYVDVARVGAGEPFQAGPGLHVHGVVTGRSGAGMAPGLRTARLSFAGLAEAPVAVPVRFYAGELTIETIDGPPSFYRDHWGVIVLRVSLPGAMDTELTLSVGYPAEGGMPAALVPPYSGSATTSLAMRLPALHFSGGPAKLPVSVAGLTHAPVEILLDIEVLEGKPAPAAVELSPAIWEAMGNWYTDLRLLFVGFHCTGESTEASESDEPRFFFGALPAGEEDPRVEDTTVFDDVDAGETRSAELELYAGRTRLIVMSVTVVEIDTGDPEHVKGIIEDAYDKAADRMVEGARAIPVIGIPAAIGATIGTILMKPWLTETLNEAFDTDDDVVGTAVIALTPQELREYRERPPADFFGIPAHFASPVITGSGEGGFIALFRVVPA